MKIICARSNSVELCFSQVNKLFGRVARFSLIWRNLIRSVSRIPNLCNFKFNHLFFHLFIYFFIHSRAESEVNKLIFNADADLLFEDCGYRKKFLFQTWASFVRGVRGGLRPPTIIWSPPQKNKKIGSNTIEMKWLRSCSSVVVFR